MDVSVFGKSWKVDIEKSLKVMINQFHCFSCTLEVMMRF